MKELDLLEFFQSSISNEVDLMGKSRISNEVALMGKSSISNEVADMGIWEHIHLRTEVKK